MNILFDINHPAHVHLFRNAIKLLKDQHHNIVVTSREKDVTVPLLDHYGIPHSILSQAAQGLGGLGRELLCRQSRLFSILRKEKIGICVSVTGACNVHVCRLLGIPTLVFYDTEHALLQNNLTIPFVTRFFTPSGFSKRFGRRHVTYNGFHDLAYLHPRFFSPDPSILHDLGLSTHDRYIIMRFVSWKAAHDVGHSGISLNFKKSLIEQINKEAKVFIVSEAPLDDIFEPYRLNIPVWRIFDALYYATMYIGEGGSMATEAAVCGTPSIYINPLKAGVFEVLKNTYQLMYSFLPDEEDAIRKTVADLFRQPDLKNVWHNRRESFLCDHIDVTQFIVDRILEYGKIT